MKDVVTIQDRFRLFLSGVRDAYEEAFYARYKEPVLVEGHFSLVARERGKIVPGSRREGKNIWTLTGREYDAQVKSYAAYALDVPARNDRIRYIGFGTGTQPEVAGVTRLVTPIAYDVANGNFLAQLNLPDYPNDPSRTTVRYARTFGELELSVNGSVILTEAGLFTDGDPAQSYAPGTRDRTLLNAGFQSPAAYKSIDPFKKTQNFSVDATWEIRH